MRGIYDLGYVVINIRYNFISYSDVAREAESMSKRHHFIESTSVHGEYARVIYCTACGMVVWNWNANKDTTPKLSDYQLKVGTPCIEAKETK